MSALAVDARTETYIDLEGMIYAAVYRFTRRYRVEFDEALAIANLAFCQSFEGYDRKRASFRTRVYQKIWSTLLEWHRTMMRRHILGKVVDVDLERIHTPDDNIWDLVEELSSDAQSVARAVLDSPREIVHDILVNGDSPRAVRNALRDFFEDCGWSTSRLAAASEELSKAL